VWALATFSLSNRGNVVSFRTNFDPTYQKRARSASFSAESKATGKAIRTISLTSRPSRQKISPSSAAGGLTASSCNHTLEYPLFHSGVEQIQPLHENVKLLRPLDSQQVQQIAKQRAMAFAMGSHERLGEASPALDLKADEVLPETLKPKP